MQYVTLGRSGLRVSRCCLGTMNFGDPTDEATSRAIIDQALDAGINFLDTADLYAQGESERIVGRALVGRREQVVLATKGVIPTGPGPNDEGASRKHLRAALDASLRRLGTDYVDLYYLHRPDPRCPLEESLAFLDDAVRAGKVLYLGCSNYWGWQIATICGLQALHQWAPLACIQPVYSIVNRDCEVEMLPAARHFGLGVVSYSPVARGVLTAKYRADAAPPPDSRAGRGNARIRQTEYRDENFAVAAALAPAAAELGCTLAQLAVAWVLANPNITAPILGPRTPQQLADNLGALEVQIPPAVTQQIDALVPPGTHPSGRYHDTLYPVTGRQ
ncbi:MAG: aldo/keto reductase [Fimbriimonadaceae bacterium]|nr:aldo/keto reductase [Fimbriimonadaceae bacterium]